MEKESTETFASFLPSLLPRTISKKTWIILQDLSLIIYARIKAICFQEMLLPWSCIKYVKDFFSDRMCEFTETWLNF